MESTNYYNTFIEIAEDCPVQNAEVPPVKGDKKTVANLQYELLTTNPSYTFTSDDVLFTVHAIRKDIIESEMENERKNFFSKGQPCFRSSPLTKRYGWGIHNNGEGKIALYSVESQEYEAFINDDSIEKKKAMRSKRA